MPRIAACITGLMEHVCREGAIPSSRIYSTCGYGGQYIQLCQFSKEFNTLSPELEAYPLYEENIS